MYSSLYFLGFQCFIYNKPSIDVYRIELKTSEQVYYHHEGKERLTANYYLLCLAVTTYPPASFLAIPNIGPTIAMKGEKN